MSDGNDGGKFEIHPDGEAPGTVAPENQAAEIAAFMRGRADEPIMVLCPDGRTFKLKRLGWLDQMRLAKALGAELAANEQYYGLATLAAMVVEINGKVSPSLVSADWVEARMQQIGDSGFSAIAECLAQLADEAKKTAMAAMVAGEVPSDAEQAYRAKVKKLLGHPEFVHRVAAHYAGVPWEIAMTAETEWLTAMMIIRGEWDGGEFDLDAWDWREKSP